MSGKPGERVTAGDVVCDYLRAQRDRIGEAEIGVRQDEPGSVHRMRVSARRLRSALQAYRRLFAPDAVRPLVDELRWLGRALAPARDTEVRSGWIEAGLDELDDALLLGPVRAQATRHFARARQQAREAAVTALDSRRYAELVQRLDALLAAPPYGARAQRRADRELPCHVRRSARRLDRAVASAVDAEPGERDAALHRARKAAKRLRYAAEVARPAVGKPAQRFARRVKGLQRHLGEHQDTVLARVELRELGAQAQQAGGNGFSFGLLYGREQERAAELRREFPALWRRTWKPQYRRWM